MEELQKTAIWRLSVFTVTEKAQDLPCWCMIFLYFPAIAVVSIHLLRIVFSVSDIMCCWRLFS